LQDPPKYTQIWIFGFESKPSGNPGVGVKFHTGELQNFILLSVSQLQTSTQSYDFKICNYNASVVVG
jgi:hypothetical protein